MTERKAVHGKLLSVQLLRAIAASGVLFAHIPFIGVGSFGVDLFFVISGFIMCYIAPGERRLFFLYRLFRIVPLYWSATLGVWLIACLAPRLVGSAPTDTVSLLSSLFFIPHARANGLALPVLGLGWTLNYEVFFYTIFAVCLLLFRARNAPIVCGLLLTGTMVVGQFDILPMPWSFWTAPYLVEFAAGIGAFYVYTLWGDNLKRAPVAVLAGFAVAGMAILTTISIINPHLRVMVIIVPCALCIFLSTLLTEGRWRIPAVAVLIGDASYSLYLLHPYVITAVQKAVNPMMRATPGAFLAAVLAMAGAAIVALVSYRLIERPSNRALRALLPGRKCSEVPDNQR